MKIDYPLKRDKYITQKFGETRYFDYSIYKIGGVSLKGHNGIDLRAATGTEVVACDEGFCQEVIDQGKVGYGKYIKVIHSWGESIYAHLSQFKVKQGDQVKKGQVIALSGNTGNSSGPHLHFAIRINPYTRSDGWGGYSDPEPHLFGETSTELDMPDWAKKLQPFFIEHKLQNGQIEGAVRQWFGDSKILQGFVQKWVDKFELKEDEADLGHIETFMEGLVDTDQRHIELVAVTDELVGHFEDEEELRNALRVLGKDKKKVVTKNEEMKDELELLKKRKVLHRFKNWELITNVLTELMKRLIEKFKKEIEKIKEGVRRRGKKI